MRTEDSYMSFVPDDTRRVRIMIVDDQPLVREGLRSILAAEPSFEVVVELSSGRQAVEQITDYQPDIVLMDINMPEMDGLAATRQLKQIYPQCEVLMLTSYDGQHYLRQALLTGASGYILKTTDRASLLAAVKTVANGGSLINPQMLRTMIQEMATNQPIQPDPNQAAIEVSAVGANQLLLANLTRREKEVLTLIGQGHSNATIAQTLSISPDTVKSHVRAILEKLGVRDRTQAAVFAVRANL